MDTTAAKTERIQNSTASAGDENARRWHTPVLKALKVSSHTLNARRGTVDYADAVFSYTS